MQERVCVVYLKIFPLGLNSTVNRNWLQIISYWRRSKREAVHICYYMLASDWRILVYLLQSFAVCAFISNKIHISAFPVPFSSTSLSLSLSLSLSRDLFFYISLSSFPSIICLFLFFSSIIPLSLSLTHTHTHTHTHTIFTLCDFFLYLSFSPTPYFFPSLSIFLSCFLFVFLPRFSLFFSFSSSSLSTF